ncbi:hypothetical protein [Paraglaciecola arctica]|uniref:hypothetical protein n=1 Tax=Paraglaciecola arctica TaxID=1128911 RepID=UPI001C078C4C|nr:hypothetical protein [Paraglaciecola arctica]MBU3003373.1 hypothetical protein [Paraglaciecola arctica]
MEVKLGLGLDGISFGISQDSLKDMIGEPDKIDVDHDELPLLQYNSLMCTFWMDKSDRLHWIQSANPLLTLQNTKVIGMEVLDIVAKLALVLGYSHEFEDYGATESYSFSEHELEIQSEYGIVTDVCFGHYWKDDEPLYTNA